MSQQDRLESCSCPPADPSLSLLLSLSSSSWDTLWTGWVSTTGAQWWFTERTECWSLVRTSIQSVLLIQPRQSVNHVLWIRLHQRRFPFCPPLPAAVLWKLYQSEWVTEWDLSLCHCRGAVQELCIFMYYVAFILIPSKTKSKKLRVKWEGERKREKERHGEVRWDKGKIDL